MKISELLDGIRKQDLVLPEFQREYVWSRDQAKQLLVSLVREYPVGSFLFWKTDDPPELKNLQQIPEKLGTVQVILDGQQRLTTLYMLLEGEIPPYYREVDITTDPRDLYFNLETADFQYYQSSKMRGNPAWKKVIDCYQDSKLNAIKIAKEITEEESVMVNLAELLNDNLNKLRGVRSVAMSIQNVPSHARLEDAIDIFDRVNSQGTKLTDADLALTHITGKWAQARRVMKEKIKDLDARHFSFDLTFMTRALTGVVVNRALFNTIHGVPREELEPGWKKLSKLLDYMASVLPSSAFIHSTDDLNTTNVLVPLIVFLSRNDGKFPNEKAMKNAFNWLYAAHTWSRYTAQTDQRLESDVSLIVREPNPWDELREQIIDQRGRIEVKADDLEGRGIIHPLFRTMFILAKAQGAVDWFNGAALGTTHGETYQIHNHHIFPASLLYEQHFDPDNHLHRKIVNEIGNRAVLTAETNLDLSNRPPEDYLPEVEERFPGALAKQFVPMDPALWRLESYSDFLEARRANIARNFNEFMQALIAEPEIVRDRTVKELIKLGESATLEFKSTFQWDMVRSQVNKELRQSVLKTIVAFLNTAGGTLVIGVEDDGNPVGLEPDLKTMKGSIDEFGKLLSSQISEYLGARFGPFIETSFPDLNGMKLCVVNVDRSMEPAFLRGPRGMEFYIRMGPTSRLLDAEETLRYTQNNWE